MRVAFYTLGCKVNHYETQAMRELFKAAGHTCVPFDAPADAYIVNTCTVTQVSDRKSRAILARAHRLNPAAPIVAVGCYAQVAPEAVAALEGVSLVVGTDGRRGVVGLVEAALAGRDIPKNTVRPYGAVCAFESLSAVADDRTRATLKIQDGCRNFCAYCAIPLARGPIRSRPLAEIQSELARLVEEGYREVVLTGIHLASWGLDSGEGDLCDVLRAAAASGIGRIRLGSLEPGFCNERFAETVAALPAVCPQFHLSLQSGSDMVLRRMRRRYDTAGYARAVGLLRQARPGCAITTDVIAGFVGETEAEHAASRAFLERMAFARIHVFPYSRRRGTAADAMPGHLPRAVREARAAELLALGNRLEAAFVAGMVGREAEVLVECDGEGYTENYVRTRVPAACPAGEPVRVRIDAAEGPLAYGTPV